jgi:hypothetical protein
MRRRADTSGDGAISEEERRAEANAFLKAITVGTRILVDGEPVDVEWGEPFVGPAEVVRPGPLAFEAVATYSIPPGEHRLTIEEHAEFEGIYRTVLTAAPARGSEIEIRGIGRGTEATDLERRLVFLDLPTPGDPPPRTATLRVVMPGVVESEGAGTSRGLWPLAVAGGLIAIIAIIVTLARRRKADS